MCVKKIVLLSAFLSPYRSGAEAMVEEVAKHLSGRYTITIVTGKYHWSLPRESVLDASAVRVIRVGLGMKIDKYLYPFLAPIIVRRLQPDIVHAVLESYAGLAMIFCKKKYPQARRILTLQSTNMRLFVNPVHRLAAYLFLGHIHRAADALTAISGVLIDRARALGRSDVELIPNGLPLRAIQETTRFHQKVECRILFVGRLEKMKGVDTLINALALLTDAAEHYAFSRQRVQLRIVGDGSQRRALQALVRSLNLQEKVTFLGKLSPTAVYDEYAQAEIFCGLSRSEALGNVFLEAEAAGCGVIATKVGGIPDIVQHEKTGLLVPPDDAEAAKEAIIQLFTDRELLKKLTDSAQIFVERYDWGTIAEKYAAIYG